MLTTRNYPPFAYLVTPRQIRPKRYLEGLLCLSIAGVFGALAGFQVFGESRDYDQYSGYFSDVRKAAAWNLFSNRWEPGFQLLSHLLARFVSSDSVVYALIVFVALVIKTAALRNTDIGKHQTIIGAFFLLYLVRYFPLWEYTQLRASVALSIAFWVFVQREGPEYHWRSIILLVAAALFHYSAAFFLLVYFVRQITRWGIFLFFWAVLITVWAAKEGGLRLGGEWLLAVETATTVESVEIITALVPGPMLLDIFLVLTALALWKYIKYPMQLCAVGLVVGFAMHLGFMDVAPIAHRLREMFTVFALVYLLHGLQVKRIAVRWSSWMLFATNVLAFGYHHFYMAKLF